MGLTPVQLRPDKIGAVITMNSRGTLPVVMLPLSNPQGHQKEPLAGFIRSMIGKGLTVLVTCGDRRTAIQPAGGAPVAGIAEIG